MKISILLVLIVIGCLSHCCILAGPLTLTPENFDQVVNGKSYVFVKFFAPWCGHCKAMVSEYEQVAAAFAGKPDVVIAEVNADSHSEISSRFGVNGFPTLKFFKKSLEPQEYKGDRKANKIIEYINLFVPDESKALDKPSKPSGVVVLNSDNFETIVKDPNNHVFVKFYAPWCGHCKRLAPDWESLAKVFEADDNVVIAKIDVEAESSIGKAYEISGYPTLKFFPKGEAKDVLVYKEGRSLKELVKYVNEKANTARTVSGDLEETFGVFESLVEIARNAMSGKIPESNALTEMKAAIQNLDQKIPEELATFYHKVVSTVSKERDYLKGEITRLTRILSGSITPKKRDQLNIRLNILKSISQNREQPRAEPDDEL